MFHMFFLVKYSKSLEEGSFRGRSADFLWMLLFGELLPAGGAIESPLQEHQRKAMDSVCLAAAAPTLWALPALALCCNPPSASSLWANTGLHTERWIALCFEPFPRRAEHHVLANAGAGMLTLIAPWVNIQFLGSSLTFMMVRSHPMYACKAPNSAMMLVLAKGHEQGLLHNCVPGFSFGV